MLPVLFIIFSSLCFSFCKSAADFLPICGRTEINNGQWVNSSAPYEVTWTQDQFLKRFVYGGPGEALNFTQVWIPQDCSYHRWNKDTLQTCAKNTQIRRNESEQEPLRIALVGDSATRGVFNGLTRLLSGSEFYGPCHNKVCGGPGFGLPITFRSNLHIYRIPFPPHVELIFMYTKTLQVVEEVMPAIKEVMKLKPYMMVLNTGAWDFDHLSRKYEHRVAPLKCDNEEFEEVAKARASPQMKQLYIDIADYAKKLDIHLIYRTNHYNRRYGANCADDRLLSLFKDTPELKSSWDVWDNFNTSRDSW